VPVPSQ
jgi:hypothetical protein